MGDTKYNGIYPDAFMRETEGRQQKEASDTERDESHIKEYLEKIANSLERLVEKNAPGELEWRDISVPVEEKPDTKKSKISIFEQTTVIDDLLGRLEIHLQSENSKLKRLEGINTTLQIRLQEVQEELGMVRAENEELRKQQLSKEPAKKQTRATVGDSGKEDTPRAAPIEGKKVFATVPEDLPTAAETQKIWSKIVSLNKQIVGVENEIFDIRTGEGGNLTQNDENRRRRSKKLYNQMINMQTEIAKAANIKYPRDTDWIPIKADLDRLLDDLNSVLAEGKIELKSVSS